MTRWPPTEGLRTWLSRLPWLKQVLGTLLLVAGLLFVINGLHGQISSLPALAMQIPLWNYAVVALLAIATVLNTACLHTVVLADLSSDAINADRARYAYAASQVARYVPGKIFGVILEAQMLAPIGLRLVVATTVIQTLLTYAWTAVLAFVIFSAIWLDSPAPLVLIPASLAFLWFAQSKQWITRLYTRLNSRKHSNGVVFESNARHRKNARISTQLLTIQWVPFLAIWIVLAASTHGISAALWLGASYLLASIGGSLLVLIPSGLVVREAAFLWLAGFSGLPAPSLITWAIVVRLALTMADVLAVPLLWLALRVRTQP